MRFAVWFGSAFALAFALASFSLGAYADTVYLADGSELKGDVSSLTPDTLKFETGFAGTLKLARDQIAGLTTDDAVPVLLESGDRVKMRFRYDADASDQRLNVVAGAADRVDHATLERVAKIRPQRIAEKKRVAKAKEYTLPQYSSKSGIDSVDWSGAARLGINGSNDSNGSNSFSLIGSINALREAGRSRFGVLAAARHATSEGDTTESSYRLQANYERNWTRRWYAFARQSLQRDPFQDYALRSQTSAGVGYFLVRERRWIFKVNSGLGYQYTNYYDASKADSALIALAGWHLGALFGDYLKLTHDFDIYSQLTNSPADKFSLRSALAVSVPIADSSLWAISAQLVNEYDNSPLEADSEELSTVYSLGIQRSF